MFFIYIFISVPFSCQKRESFANDLSIKECGECRELFSQPLDFQVAAQVRVLLVDMLEKKASW